MATEASGAPVYHSKSPALEFTVHAVIGRARAATLLLPHGPLRAPVFMPVGTKGTIKGLSSCQLRNESELAPEIILGNTYHLALEPTTDLLEELGGLHRFMNWEHNLLTDSGGFQMVSLLKLAEITEQGVKFISPLDNTSEMMLTPEQSIRCQNQSGADIIMQLDDVSLGMGECGLFSLRRPSLFSRSLSLSLSLLLSTTTTRWSAVSTWTPLASSRPRTAQSAGSTAASPPTPAQTRKICFPSSKAGST